MSVGATRFSIYAARFTLDSFSIRLASRTDSNPLTLTTRLRAEIWKSAGISDAHGELVTGDRVDYLLPKIVVGLLYYL